MTASYRSSRSTQFNTRGQRMWGRNQNTVAFAPTANLGPVAHTVIIALMVAVLGLIYLTQVTKTSFYGYTLNNLSDKQSALKDEGQYLAAENARLEALQRVKDSNVAKAMTSPATVDYAAN